MNKWMGTPSHILYIFFKLTNQSSVCYPMRCNSYIPQICEKLHITSCIIIKNLLMNLFLPCNGMYFLYTMNFIISFTNQPLMLALGGWLEQKNR